ELLLLLRGAPHPVQTELRLLAGGDVGLLRGRGGGAGRRGSRWGGVGRSRRRLGRRGLALPLLRGRRRARGQRERDEQRAQHQSTSLSTGWKSWSSARSSSSFCEATFWMEVVCDCFLVKAVSTTPTSALSTRS